MGKYPVESGSSRRRKCPDGGRRPEVVVHRRGGGILCDLDCGHPEIHARGLQVLVLLHEFLAGAIGTVFTTCRVRPRYIFGGDSRASFPRAPPIRS